MNDDKNIKEAYLSRIYKKYGEVILLLKNNITKYDFFPKPILTVGPEYPGIWLEHNHDWLFYYRFEPEVAMASHELFYHLQAEDGLFPSHVCKWPDEPEVTIGYAQVQTVFPIATSAWELAKVSKNEEFLSRSYNSCAKYDEWLMKYRNTRGTGLIEMFCEYDTGHDNSRRVKDGNIPHQCKDGNARLCPDNEILPIIAPDLTSTVYAGKLALAEMAEALDKGNEGAIWSENAMKMKENLIKTCFDEEDEFFYDLDAKGNFRKYKSEHIFRLLMNRILDQDMADRIYSRYIRNPEHFWTPYPFPSISISDPAHDKSYPPNSWGGQSQAHTALETLFWMEHYGKKEDLDKVMKIWLDSFMESNPEFSQEMNPVTGKFSNTKPNFTTSLLAFVEFVDRLYPLKET